MKRSPPKGGRSVRSKGEGQDVRAILKEEP